MALTVSNRAAPAISPDKHSVGFDFNICAATSDKSCFVNLLTSAMNSSGDFLWLYVNICLPMSSATTALDSKFIKIEEIVAFFALSTSSSVI